MYIQLSLLLTVQKGSLAATVKGFCHVTKVWETVSCVKNRVMLLRIDHVVEPFPGPRA